MKSKILDIPVELERELSKKETKMKRKIVTQTEVMDLLVSVTYEAQKGILQVIKGSKISFDNPESCSDDFYHSLTGVTKSQFDELLTGMKLRSSKSMSKRNNLAVYLMRLRTGLNLQCLSKLFGCKSRREVSQRLVRVRKQLFKSKFMSEHFGFGQMTKDTLIQKHSTQFAKSFFGQDETGQPNKPVVIVDGVFSLATSCLSLWKVF